MRTRNLVLPDKVSDEALVGYARCYQLETWFRELVYLDLKAHFGTAWWNKAKEALQRSPKGYIPAERSLDSDKTLRTLRVIAHGGILVYINVVGPKEKGICVGVS